MSGSLAGRALWFRREFNTRPDHRAIAPKRRISTRMSSMTETPRSPLAQLRVWHLALLVLFVAIAIADIQDHHRGERALIVLASVGYGLYGLIGWLAWRLVRRFEARIGRTRLLILYMVAMAAFFLLATVVYLVIE